MTGLMAWMCVGAALASEPEEAAVYRLYDVSAYTVPHQTWLLGLSGVDYGLGEHTSVGTRPLRWLFGANARAKVTALERDRIAVSAQAEVQDIHSVILASFLDTQNQSLDMKVIPLETQGSWMLNEHWSVHFGVRRTFVSMNGELTGREISRLVGSVTGGGVNLTGVLGKNTVYLGAEGRIRLGGGSFAVEWRRTERNTFIFESNSYVFASGLVVGTVNNNTSEDTSVGAGAAAAFDVALTSFPNASSLAWHRHGERLNFRVGVPISLFNPFSYVQAFSLYWLI